MAMKREKFLSKVFLNGELDSKDFNKFVQKFNKGARSTIINNTPMLS